MQLMVYSCIARQYYYEKKLLYGARKQERRERKKMQKQFEFAEEESKFLREQRISELAEQRAMATEEQYQKDLEWGKLMEACLSVWGGYGDERWLKTVGTNPRDHEEQVSICQR